MSRKSEEKTSEESKIPVTQITSLPIEHLQEILKSVKSQQDGLITARDALINARSRYSNANEILDSFTISNNNNSVMIPLTESLYISGKLDSNTVLVDLGVGYYGERTPKQGKEYFTRKVKFINDKLGILSKKIQTGEDTLKQIEQVMKIKLEQKQSLNNKSNIITE